MLPYRAVKKKLPCFLNLLPVNERKLQNQAVLNLALLSNLIFLIDS